MSHAAITVVTVALLGACSAAAVPTGSPAANAALALCNRADDATEVEKAALLDQGLELAEQAVEADVQDPAAHFAVFCTLGKRTELDRAPLRSLFALRRLRRELDLTLALVPNDPDALAAKGALLFNLPRLFGGDTMEAEHYLRRALEIEPTNDEARRYLVRVLTARGASEEANALLVSH